MFLDESGFRLGSDTRYGWAPIGEDAIGKHVCGRWEQITMIGAIALGGFRGLMTINAGTSSEVFLAYVKKVLLPNLKSGDIVVMDNLSAHKNKTVRQCFEDKGVHVLYIPPYSPQYNPIEKVWSKLKTFIRRCKTLTREQFDNAVASAMDTITKQDILGWFKHCGYSIK